MFILEMSEWLSPERCRHLLESLKKKIAEREEYYKLKDKIVKANEELLKVKFEFKV